MDEHWLRAASMRLTQIGMICPLPPLSGGACQPWMLLGGLAIGEG